MAWGVLALALAATIGACDSASLVAESTPSNTNDGTEATSVVMGSMAEFHQRLPSLGVPLEGSGQQRWLNEHRMPVVMENGTRVSVGEKRLSEGEVSNVLMALVKPDPGVSSKQPGAVPQPSARRDGAYARRASGYGLNEGVRLPPPDAQSTTASLTAKEFSDDTQVTALFPCEYDCVDFGETPYVPPNFVGTSALRFDPFLKGGYATWEARTEVEEYAGEVHARTQTHIDINRGEYQETTVPYTFTRHSAKIARAISSDLHYKGYVQYQAHGDHWYTKYGDASQTRPSSAGAVTNFSNPSCAPFPNEGHTGKTFPEHQTFSVAWQTICPQKSKVLQIRRINGPGGTKTSAQVQTQGDGWSLKPFEAWNGIFLNDGTYTWTIKASGESATQSGTFSIDRNNLCRPSVHIVDVLATGSSVAAVRVGISGCAPDGAYRFVLSGTTVDGAFRTMDSVRIDKSGNGGTIDLTVPFNLDVRAGDLRVSLTQISPYNGSVRVASVPVQ